MEGGFGKLHRPMTAAHFVQNAAALRHSLCLRVLRVSVVNLLGIIYLTPSEAE